MTTRVIRSVEDIDKLARFIGARSKFPMTVTLAQGASRSNLQNRLSQCWFTDISRQLDGETHEEIRAYCKLQFGVPILLAENDAFRVNYERVMGALSYDEKLSAIKAFDLPVTRLMTSKQMTAFMDEMQRYWSQLGFRLTDPEAMKYEEEFA